MTELVDSSVWIEMIRNTRSPAAVYLEDRLKRAPGAVRTTEPIVMELYAGPAREESLSAVQALVDAVALVRIAPAVDFTSAAALFRAARRGGCTVRTMNDCLIAAVAIRTGTTLVHRDADFDVIASISSLRTRSFVDP
ncbi:type II toxin-antitoxin system VapC family toxin [Luteipulveratus flavus]|uniref:Ribonuclease VapC n=1 Tax=Luteipulveratus flavus TaxID=3031728 RepID=A0ABT6C9W1_9MICO|nr:PIN domain nuclease [Luteipulveratus sp. YIM 133296]MDF8265685.1 PIN domain nuclease [Luteipulveratus sp. YIM 133296]